MTFVLVHGASHGAWCWRKVIPLLERNGHCVIAPDLAGHGEDNTAIREVTLRAYTDRICQALDEREELVVLVGHSMGGTVITQVAEFRPEKLEKLVYVAAVIPANGMSNMKMTRSSRNPDWISVDEDERCYVYKDKYVSDIFYGDCTEDDIAVAKRMLCRQAMAPVTEPVRISVNNYGRVPRAYIACLQDRVLPPELQKSMYAAALCTTVVEMYASHSPFFSAPETLAKHLQFLAQS